MAYIQSARNPLVKEAWLAAATGRRRGLVLVEGPKSIEDAVSSGARFRHAFTRGEVATSAAVDALLRVKVPVHGLDPKLFDKLSATEASQGLIAFAAEPHSDAFAIMAVPDAGPLAVLDRIQDPGNVGTILRTAAALGFRGAALTKGTADPFAPKVVRAAAGTLFRFPIFSWDAGLLERCVLVVAAAEGEPPPAAFARARATGRPLALVVGNEGQGVAPDLVERAVARAWIPLARGVESLNVAAAFAMLAYALTEPGARVRRDVPRGTI